MSLKRPAAGGESCKQDSFSNRQQTERLALVKSFEIGYNRLTKPAALRGISFGGSTLKENGLKVLEEVCPLSARMVVNQVSMKMENERIRKLIDELRRVLQEEM